MLAFSLKAALTILATVSCLHAHAVEVGESVPDFQLQGDHSPVSLATGSGKVVYLDYWASWCGPCRQSFPWMNEMQTKYGPLGLQIIAINLDTKASIPFHSPWFKNRSTRW